MGLLEVAAPISRRDIDFSLSGRESAERGRQLTESWVEGDLQYATAKSDPGPSRNRQRRESNGNH
jgi:hypothetical protein